MCGFVGCIHDREIGLRDSDRQLFKNMNDIITHRGPDDEGFFEDEHIQFGFRRLSIIDIESGHQPLTYENERYWIIFNGEIYNYVELRNELIEMGLTFETSSDTEVIIALYSHYKEKAVEKLRGMFAFTIWDKQEQVLIGARDPFGIKPFFYREDEKRTFFASEKKSILLAMDHEELNYDAAQHYMTYQFVPEPETMTKGIKKLEPGHYFTKKPGEKMKIERYWKASFQPVQKSEDEFVKEIRDVLFDSVNVHMRSDVPVGSFLSGGIDSSIIASIAKQYHPNIKTFSVGFEHNGFSEIDVAKETAEKLGVENISYIISPEEYMKELPKIIWHLDDPLADPACVPLYFVAREARKHVTVVLSGEGADELFGGYNIYREPQSLEVFDKIPAIGKSLLKALAKILPEGVKGKSFIERGVTPMEQRYIGNAKMYTEAEKKDLLAQYRTGIDYTDITKPLYAETRGYDPVDRMQYIDIHTWMRGDILLKADKMTMAHSLELRVPFLDKEVFKIASKIPTSLKTANNTTKYILRKAAEGVVPDHVLNRKKLGFPVPIRHWLKNEMNDWAKQIIHESATDHIINKHYVLNLLEEHCQGKMDHSRKIWTVLVFMIWHAVYVEEKYDFQKQYKLSAATL
ncbi:asparagine synthase (glutamine-hydrolyzing) [Heyndrickxia oleronia]|jgi:asparagine synthase (glutamine-hydrolysing)|uniref:asparagine synthase (glutamine-hydrolyzing) n=1 Tax=Heyndrickxia oleronia TaxID=38875 RepID=A0AAW6SZ44_9BACI|nr:asparagine synthase (glutamine-hydrolyzing) [Heyndrickxia oleronia]MCI1592168.1 asparagine synthase (glutamine-hydrolyzing) [Heyndrickxia oleronia]MCI1612722.1 asparagine synthase (glutamine-hydrolyzing) [Heyndrickxia oleronia]MCI1744020.1 asparagine synthase (glutamine-hydrolyzing) [Heyndrickxia oleronia]MCI1760734.1 asparagine synthase (glutamine-hydrolyzing) [Heyndrickxia oleronia]MDH5164036.1 asparagine synthase (glutamine-hydrolyzing) [Heyndrickxia oleronia]